MTVALLTPPVEAGEVIPAPEFARGFKVIVATGLVAVDPSNDMSGITRFTNENLCPSSKSNSADSTNAVIAVSVAVSLSFIPSSWLTKLLLYVAANGLSRNPESSHAVRARVP